MRPAEPVSIPRSSGILMHPTSLPGPFGIGDLGPLAHAWINLLAAARQQWWQILPLGPTGFGDSPYQSFSAFAGNPLLISPEILVQEGLVQESDIPDDFFPGEAVDFSRVVPFKQNLTARAWSRFQEGANSELREPFEEFRLAQEPWLDDFALFLAIKETQGLRSWQEWPRELRLRHPAALKKARQELQDAVGLHQFRQFLFDRQWQALRDHAHEQGVRIIGDVPIFIAPDSADVWTHPELFLLDENRRPTHVAGVPPDYFCDTGQLWGNPLYRWKTHQASGFAWWTARMKATLNQVDLVRLDHFRGFEAYWAVPAGHPTAQEGEWVPGPADALFAALEKNLGPLPFIAEDLGVITPEVNALRLRWHLPGMRILQFAFGGAQEHRFLPHRYDNPTVVYTGTHDNDTTQGWFEKLTETERSFFRRYAPATDTNPARDLIRLAWASTADLAVAPLQDLLGLGTEARMNYPGRPEGNWRWRFQASDLTDNKLQFLAEVTEVYERVPPTWGSTP